MSWTRSFPLRTLRVGRARYIALATSSTTLPTPGFPIQTASFDEAQFYVFDPYRGDLEHYAADQTMELNRASIEDRRGMAELVRRLRTREVEKEKFERDAWLAALEKWRCGRACMSRSYTMHHVVCSVSCAKQRRVHMVTRPND